MKTNKMKNPEAAVLPSYEEFVNNQNSHFNVILPDRNESILLLSEVTEKRTSKYQEQFSLFFAGKEFLPQAIYSLKHDILGNFDLFLVPVEKNEKGFLYEAVFNNLLQS